MSLFSNTVALVALSVGLAACAGQETPRPDVAPDSTDRGVGCRMPPAGDAGHKTASGRVKLEVEIPQSFFLKGQDVSVTVWNEAQMALREKSGSCSVSMDRSGKETTTCPPGITYVKPTPETFKVAYSELGSKVVLDVSSLAVGERFDVNIGGAASDGCNHTGAGSRGVAAQKIQLADLSYATTEMYCEPR